MSKEKKSGKKNNNNNKSIRKKFLWLFSKTQLFQLPSLWNSYYRVFLSIYMQSSECILVITCLLFLLHLGLHRYPSRLISHCQGWCPIGKFSRFLHKFFQILPLTVKILAFSIGFSFPFMYPFFYFIFFSFFFFICFPSLSSCCSYYL